MIHWVILYREFQQGKIVITTNDTIIVTGYTSFYTNTFHIKVIIVLNSVQFAIIVYKIYLLWDNPKCKYSIICAQSYYSELFQNQYNKPRNFKDPAKKSSLYEV